MSCNKVDGRRLLPPGRDHPSDEIGEGIVGFLNYDRRELLDAMGKHLAKDQDRIHRFVFEGVKRSHSTCVRPSPSTMQNEESWQGSLNARIRGGDISISLREMGPSIGL